jgi:hypothetical protein
MEDLARWFSEQLDADADRAGRWHDLECEIHAHLGSVKAAAAVASFLSEVPGVVCDCGGPRRTLAEIEAKRSIVTLYDKAAGEAVRLAQVGEDCEEWVQTAGLLQVCVCRLAVAYADRPGYLESWRP